LALEEIKNPHKNDKSEFVDESQVPEEKGAKAEGNERYEDNWEDGVEYESLTNAVLKKGTKYRLRLKNRDPSAISMASLKVVITEFDAKRKGWHSEDEDLPKDIEEVKRLKPKVPGMKESSFIQGSKAVMDTFKVASLEPFIPKSKKIY